MATSKTSSAAKTTTPRRPAVTAKWIRNRRNHPVHLRFKQEGGDRPFFVELAPRGITGDVEKIPAKLTQTRAFSEAVYQELVEIITEVEANKIHYPLTGYLRDDVTVIRPEDTVVASRLSLDKQIEQNPRGKIRTDTANPQFVEAAGSMRIRTDGGAPSADDMIPADVDLTSRKVTVERTSG